MGRCRFLNFSSPLKNKRQYLHFLRSKIGKGRDFFTLDGLVDLNDEVLLLTMMTGSTALAPPLPYSYLNMTLGLYYNAGI